MTTVGEWIREHPGLLAAAPSEASVDELLDLVLKEQPAPRDVYVEDAEGRVVGHIPRASLARAALAEHRPVHTRRQVAARIAGAQAKELMRAPFAFARPDERLDEVLHRMLENGGVEDMPVLDADGKALGAVNLTRAMRHLRREAGREGMERDGDAQAE